MSKLEDDFAFLLKKHKIDGWVREYKFHPERRWKFDFAWPNEMIAAEVEGGVFNSGRHLRPIGFINDCEKYNEAVALGWSVLRFTANVINDGSFIHTLGICLKMKNPVVFNYLNSSEGKNASL
jgi:very-short-patch-repair endonuclease